MQFIMEHLFSSLLVIITATLQLGAGSQDLQETEYIFGFPSNFDAASTYTRVIITSTSSTSQDVTVNTTDKVLFAGHVRAGQPAVVDVPKEMVVLSGWPVDREKGIRVTTSSTDLSVVAVNSYNPYAGMEYTMLASTASFKVLPYKKIAAKEYNYYAVTTDSIDDDYSSEILLVAYEDNTEIKITSPSPSILLNIPRDMRQGNDSQRKYSFHTVILHRMQTLLIKDASHDLTGTLISSNHQLSVITGHECGNVPTNQQHCDHLLVQVPPTYSWGKEFLLFPMKGREAGQNYKVVASHHGTSVSLVCKTHPETTFALKWKGSFSEFHTVKDDHCSLVSNKPVLVALLGIGYKADKIGDPSMTLITPVSDFTDKSVVFHSLNGSDFTQQYVTIIASSKIGAFKFDGRSIKSYYWKKIWGPDQQIKGYMITKQLQPSQFNKPIALTSSTSSFAAFIYGYGKNRHSYSYSVSQDWLPPLNVPVMSFHKGSTVHMEPSGAVSVGLGRVDATDTAVTVKIVISGCSSTTESSIAMAAEVPQDFELTNSEEGHSDSLPFTRLVTFAPGETDKTIETIELMDDGWTEPIKGIRVELLEVDGHPIEIIGYDKTVISVLDDDALKIDVTMEKSASVAELSEEGTQSFENIMIKVEMSRGWLLPGTTFPIILRGLFPNGNFSTIEQKVYLSNNITHIERHILQECSMGSRLEAIVEVDPDIIESKLPFVINDNFKEWHFKACATATLPSATKTHSLSSATIPVDTQLPSRASLLPSISQTSLLSPPSVHSSSVFQTTSVPQVSPVHTISPSFSVPKAPASSTHVQETVTSVRKLSHSVSTSSSSTISLSQISPLHTVSPVHTVSPSFVSVSLTPASSVPSTSSPLTSSASPLSPVHTVSPSFSVVSQAPASSTRVQEAVTSVWRSSHSVSTSSPLVTPVSLTPSHSQAFSSSFQPVTISSSSLPLSSVTSIVSSPAIVTSTNLPLTTSTESPSPSLTHPSGTASFVSSVTTTKNSFPETSSLVLKPSPSSSHDASTPTQSLPLSITLRSTSLPSDPSSDENHTRFPAEASPTIASVAEDSMEEVMFVSILVGVLTAAAVILSIVIAAVLLVVMAVKKRNSGSWSPRPAPVNLTRSLQYTERSESFEKV